MTLNSKIASDVQKSDLGKVVSMYEIDVDSTIYRFVNSTDDGSSIIFNSNTYVPIDIKTSGMGSSNNGRSNNPTFQISNVEKTLQSVVDGNNYLLGCTLTLRRTLYKYLDGQAGADTNAIFPLEVHIFNQMKTKNKNLISWALTPYVSLEKIQLPKRIFVRDYCPFTYRYYTGSAFDYTGVSCPYTDTNYFDKSGNPCSAADDNCGRRLTDCRLRYPNDTDELVFGGFQGILRGGSQYI